ncbi:MAG: DUF4382 domain-containing protein [Armatimonadota bacterium]
MLRKTSFIVLTLAAIAIIFAGCGGGGGDAPGIPDDGSGGDGGNDVATTADVRVLLTDAPVADLSEVWVNILRIELVPADEGPIVVLDSGELPAMFELLSLAADPVELGIIEAPVGVYEQVRLVLAEDGHFLVDSDGVEHGLRVPSGAQTGVKVNFPDSGFEVSEGQTTLLLDFLAGPSVHQAGQSGQWIMRPVIHGSSFGADLPEFGGIEGTVAYEDGSIPQALDGNPPAVFLDGNDAESMAEIDPETGAFAIPSLPAGECELEVGWLNEEGEMADAELLIIVDANAREEIDVIVEADDTRIVDLTVREGEADDDDDDENEAPEIPEEVDGPPAPPVVE